MYKEPNTNWIRPIDNFLWPWGFGPGICPRLDSLDSLGLHKAMEPCFSISSSTMSGVGKYGRDVGAEGEVRTTRGCFIGEPFCWMCTTGSVLSSLAEHYRYSRRRLAEDRSAQYAGRLGLDSEEPRNHPHACGRWQESGPLRPVAQGMATDWPGYRITTLSRMRTPGREWPIWPRLSRKAGLPEAEPWPTTPTNIASASWTPCIASIRRPRFGPALRSRYRLYRQGERGGVWPLDGPRGLFDRAFSIR